MKQYAKCISLNDDGETFQDYTVGKTYEIITQDGYNITLINDFGKKEEVDGGLDGYEDCTTFKLIEVPQETSFLIFN